MSDVFISYARNDRDKAKALAEVLADQGWSVWWDRTIPPGKPFDEVIEHALDTAKCVIVLWSKSSIASSWVKNESAEAMRRNILVPVLIEDVRIPLEFRRLQAADLRGWQPGETHPELEQLFDSVRACVSPTDGGPLPRRIEKPEKAKPPIKKAFIAGAIIIAAIVIGYAAYNERAKRMELEQKLIEQEIAARNLERERLAREQAAQEQAAREKAAREQAAREQATKEQAAREQRERDIQREQLAKEQAAREQAAREEAARDRAASEQRQRDAQREQLARERAAYQRKVNEGSVTILSASCVKSGSDIYVIRLSGRALGPPGAFLYGSSNPNLGVQSGRTTCSAWSATRPEDGVRNSNMCKRLATDPPETSWNSSSRWDRPGAAPPHEGIVSLYFADANGNNYKPLARAVVSFACN